MTDAIVFTRGVPPPEAFPTKQLAECFDAALERDPSVVLQYGQQQGYQPLRHELAREYGVSEAEVLVGNGSLQLQDLVAANLIHPGAVVFTEQPSYDRAITTFRRRGARVIGIPLESDGISIEALEFALKRNVPAFLYLVPDFQNPAGATLSLEKRRRVAELAEKYGFWVIEDVPYRKLRFRGEEAPLLRQFAPSRVMTMSSFSKLLSPGLRVGFMIAPAELIKGLTKLGEDTYLSPVLPSQAAVAEYLRRGWLQPNIDRLKALYRPRWETMANAVRRELPEAQAFIPDGGFFVSVMLPEHAHTENLIGRAKDAGLVLTPGGPFFADPHDGMAVPSDRFVRLPFCALTPDQINEGVRRLAGLLHAR
ncbi:PLP-dependent aminotransferase family protein [Vitiosangium sp. GDMCC 1.1324]|uniref:aminotransferase-like domain-containing protein n=1 Tax=Vitiosangium sp. (strain GDMCC 1.1324) TaxID=2138576 RepID=UPI000D3BEF55|nr:PLP-dependent aminotransferase family protein [Vitiosangium sp. GDMCC 1.1324]PTL77742.1 PLP-dependent aminotransferase family protein [Vitiosangium sp. GDMCC 1.1324]